MENHLPLYSETEIPSNTAKLDTISSALAELYFIEHPQVQKGKHDTREVERFISEHEGSESWAYYPWRGVAVRVPNEEIYVRLRTARNRNLISPEEQLAFRDSTIGIAGLSVGSTALAALVLTGGPKRIKIADPDIVEITNLNRMRATLLDVGQKKTTVAARAAWEIDPYLEIDVWEEGVSADTLEKFVLSPRLNVCIDEMDDIKLKFACRSACKKHGVPVVMATDNGDSVILDVERFDLEPEREIFHGRVHIDEEEMREMSREKFVAMANDIIDPSFFTMRQQASIMEIGKTLAGVPQLGTAATLAGVAVAYATRRIITGLSMPSGRYVMGCDASFDSTYDSQEERAKRSAHTQLFIDSFKRK